MKTGFDNEKYVERAIRCMASREVSRNGCPVDARRCEIHVGDDEQGVYRAWNNDDANVRYTTGRNS